MYCVVILEGSLEVKAIPVKFVKGFNPICTANDAVNQSKSYIVFYDQNHCADPDFKMDLSEQFNENGPACYKGRIWKFFSEFNLLFFY